MVVNVCFFYCFFFDFPVKFHSVSDPENRECVKLLASFYELCKLHFFRKLLACSRQICCECVLCQTSTATSTANNQSAKGTEMTDSMKT